MYGDAAVGAVSFSRREGMMIRRYSGQVFVHGDHLGLVIERAVRSDMDFLSERRGVGVDESHLLIR